MSDLGGQAHVDRATRIAASVMWASTAWSLLVVWQLIGVGRSTFLVDEVPVGSQWDVSWVLVAVALLTGVSSCVAAVMLGRGRIGQARPAMAIATVTGLVGLLSVLAAIASMWVTRRTR